MGRRRFLIVGLQRSGTSVTHACLSGHPEIAMAGGEVYPRPFFTRGIATFTSGDETWRERRDGLSALFDAMTLRGAGESTTAHGCKTALASHDDAIDVANALRDCLRDVRVVLVRRDDVVAQFGSLVRAQATGIWHSSQGRGGRGSMHLDAGEFARYAEDCRHAIAQLRTLESTHPVLELDYDDHIAPGRWRELFAFVGVRELTPTWIMSDKLAPPARDYIANYDELQAILDATPEPTPEAERAAAAARLVASLRHEAPGHVLSRAQAELESRRFGDAEVAALAALERDEDLPAAQRHWAFSVLETAWANLGDGGRASSVLERLERRFGDDAGFLCLLGTVECHLGDREAGLRRLERAVAIDPELRRARERLDEWRGPAPR